MSERGPATTDARLGVAVRPFRLAVLALAEPLALLETLLDVADSLPTALQPRLGMLDVDSFGVLASEAAPGTDAADRRSGRGRGRRDAETTQTAPPPVSADGGPKAHARAPRLQVDEEMTAEPPGDTGSEALTPAGTTATAGSAIVAEGSLLERLADAALEAVSPSSSRNGGARRTLPADAAPGDRRRDSARGPASPKSRGAGTAAVGSAARRIAEESPAFGRPTEAARDVTGASAAGRLVPAAGARAAASELSDRSPSPAGAAPPRNRELTPRPHDAFAERDAAGIADPVLQTGGGAPAQGLSGAGLLEQLADSALAASEPARAELAAPPAHADATRRARALDQLFPGEHSPARSSEPDSPAPALPSGPDTPTRPAEAGAVAAPPQELAWLVNEALVEQARRHGVDLS